jgi:hypothetical protein
MVEQRHVARLCVHQIGDAQVRHERSERAPLRLGQRALRLENGRHLVQVLDQLLLGVDEQGGEDFERQHVPRSPLPHDARSPRVLRVSGPNRLNVLLPSLQPAPKENPQMPR